MKVLYIPDHKFTLTVLRKRVGDFTLHNGCYPERIEMEKKGMDYYQSLLLYPSDRNKLTFDGIRVVKKGGEKKRKT